MKIKFLKGDPRAGTVVALDSSLAQRFIDEGRAVKVSEGAAEEKAIEAAPANKAIMSAPANKAVAKKAKAK